MIEFVCGNDGLANLNYSLNLVAKKEKKGCSKRCVNTGFSENPVHHFGASQK
jgi:hypothetical protein